MKRINFWRIVLALAFMTLFTGISSSETAYKYTVTFTPDTGGQIGRRHIVMCGQMTEQTNSVVGRAVL